MKTLAIALLFAASSVAAAQQQCVCTAGCKIAVWNNTYPTTGGSVPTSCTIYKAGAPIATGTWVAGAALNNAGTCLPADAPVTPTAGMCVPTIPAQAAGTVTLTATATNAAGETAQSTPFVFVSVGALATILPAPTNLRVVP